MKEIKELEAQSPKQAKEELIVDTGQAKRELKSAPIGSKGGKIGRPPGAKNKDTIFKELMTGNFQSRAIKDIEKVYSVLFEKAHNGDMKAIKLVLDRVVPVTKAVDANQIKGGVTVSINVGSLEAAQAITIEDAEYEEVDEEY